MSLCHPRWARTVLPVVRVTAAGCLRPASLYTVLTVVCLSSLHCKHVPDAMGRQSLGHTMPATLQRSKSEWFCLSAVELYLTSLTYYICTGSKPQLGWLSSCTSLKRSTVLSTLSQRQPVQGTSVVQPKPQQVYAASISHASQLSAAAGQTTKNKKVQQRARMHCFQNSL